MNKIILTGASGFIGTHFLDQFSLSNEYQIKIFNRNKDINEQLDGATHIIHLAGLAHSPQTKERSAYIEANVEFTKKLAQSALHQGVQHFIFMSTIGVLGKSTTKDQILHSTSSYLPYNHYSESKMLAEQYLIENWKNHLIILRPSGVYGKNPKGNFALLSKLAGLPLPFKNIHNHRNFLFINHLIQIIESTLSIQDNKIINCCDPWSLSTSELIEQICRAKKVKNLSFPFSNALLKSVLKLTNQGEKLENIFGDLLIDHSDCQSLISHPIEKEKAFNISFAH